MDVGGNQALSDCLLSAEHTNYCTGYSLITPFTGLPADYDLFAAGPRLVFVLPVDNPFVRGGDHHLPDQAINAIIPINLPGDLSPYGIYWRLNRATVGTVQVEHIQTNLAGPTAHDEMINQLIDDRAAQHPTVPVLQTVLDGDVLHIWSTLSSPEAVYLHLDYATGQELVEQVAPDGTVTYIPI